VNAADDKHTLFRLHLSDYFGISALDRWRAKSMRDRKVDREIGVETEEVCLSSAAFTWHAPGGA